MAAPQRPFFPQSHGVQPPRARSSTPVLAVGHRVLVSCPGNGAHGVTLTDSDGTTPVATLADGAEVEIVAWQPRGAGGTRYRIKATSGGLQGWLAAANLRPRPLPPEPPRPVVTPPAPTRAPAPQATAAPRRGAAKKSRGRAH
jgi:hypothetical protein